MELLSALLMVIGAIVLVVFVLWQDFFREISINEYEEIKEILLNTKNENLKEMINQAYKKGKISKKDYKNIIATYGKIIKNEKFVNTKDEIMSLIDKYKNNKE